MPLSLSPSGVKAGRAAGGKGWSRRGGPARGVRGERAARQICGCPYGPDPAGGARDSGFLQMNRQQQQATRQDFASVGM